MLSSFFPSGTYSAGHTDKLSRLKDVCDQSGLWLHVEGWVGSLILKQTKTVFIPTDLQFDKRTGRGSEAEKPRPQSSLMKSVGFILCFNE